MKKVFAEGYWKVNLGDDLFLKILCDRYKDVEFTILADKAVYSKMSTNLKVINNTGFVYRAINKLSNKKLQCAKKVNEINKSNGVVYIGGAIFMQHKNYKRVLTDRYLKHNKKYFIIGSNFGPYSSEDYKEFCKNKIFANAEDVCFRENYSHELFRDLDNVRHCSDIVFLLDKSRYNSTNEKRVVFSIIDCEHKGCLQYKEQYINKIIEMTNYFVQREYKVTYMSFCKVEKDEVAINEIMQKLTEDNKENVSVYNYRGNLQEALQLINSSEIVVGSRFHANIIGLLLDKKIVPIGYSKKTENALRDINYQGEIVDIKNIGNINIEEVINKNLNYEFNIEECVKDAKGHFEKLDKYIEEE